MSKEDEARLFSVVPNDRMRRNEHRHEIQGIHETECIET